jgi:predicted flap endonuclease-1-like 5' DNA nuclease
MFSLSFLSSPPSRSAPTPGRVKRNEWAKQAKKLLRDKK